MRRAEQGRRDDERGEAAEHLLENIAEDRAESDGCVVGASVERARCTGLARPSAACATPEEKAESELSDNMRE